MKRKGAVVIIDSSDESDFQDTSDSTLLNDASGRAIKKPFQRAVLSSSQDRPPLKVQDDDDDEESIQICPIPVSNTKFVKSKAATEEEDDWSDGLHDAETVERVQEEALSQDLGALHMSASKPSEVQGPAELMEHSDEEDDYENMQEEEDDDDYEEEGQKVYSTSTKGKAHLKRTREKTASLASRPTVFGSGSKLPPTPLSNGPSRKVLGYRRTSLTPIQPGQSGLIGTAFKSIPRPVARPLPSAQDALKKAFKVYDNAVIRIRSL